MTDREKVIKGLECCKGKTCVYEHPTMVCPYLEMYGEYETAREECTKELAKDALELLRDYDERYTPIKPVVKEPDNTWNCGHCGAWIGRSYNFCHKCGRAVKRK